MGVHAKYTGLEGSFEHEGKPKGEQEFGMRPNSEARALTHAIHALKWSTVNRGADLEPCPLRL